MVHVLCLAAVLAVSSWGGLPGGAGDAAGGDDPAMQAMVALVDKTLAEAEQLDNAEHRANLDRIAKESEGDFKGGLAESYYAHAAMLFMQHYFDEAWYGFAKAADIAPANGVYLINLAAVLLERQKVDDALAILEIAVVWFPELDAAWGNLGVARLDKGLCKEALDALGKALELDPDNGLWNAAYARALKCVGKNKEAAKFRKRGWDNGYGDDEGEGEGEGEGEEGQEDGEGKEGKGGEDKGGEKDGKGGKGAGEQGGGAGGDAKQGEGGQPAGEGEGDAGGGQGPGQPAKGGDGPPKAAGDKIPAEWVGHYEAKVVRMTAGGPRAFGEGLATTIINVDVLACAKVFGMDVAADGSLAGKGMLFYVFNGEASNPAMAMAGMFGALIYGGFASSIKDGAETREWTFSGKVLPDGQVEIAGLPEDKLDFYNMGEWDEIMPWSPLPPPDTGHMRGPFKLSMVSLADGTPAILADRWLELDDPLLQKLHYETVIVKSDRPVRPECKYIRKKKGCPGTEYLKTKVAFGNAEAVVVETSTEHVSGKVETTTKVGNSTLNVESTGKVNVELSHGMLTGSVKYNPVDGSYVVGVGVGVDTKSVLKNAPASIKEKVELIYDSRCGWGIRGTFSAGYRKQSAGIEGAVFFSKGV